MRRGCSARSGARSTTRRPCCGTDWGRSCRASSAAPRAPPPAPHGAAAASSATATLAARSGPLVEIRRVPELRLFPVVGGVTPGIERSRPELAALVHGVEVEAELRLAVGPEQARLGELDDPLEGLEARIGRLHAAAHEFDGQEGATHLDVRFAAARGARRTDVVVGVLAGADDGAVAHPAGNLE